MKKWLIVFIIFCMTGCYHSKENIHTIIEEENNIRIGINYPITGIKKLDNMIKKDIENNYNNFKENYNTEQAELNIDYTYEKVSERYINITLHIFINSSTLAHPNNYMISYVYDKKQNRQLELKDFIKEEDFPHFIEIVKLEVLKKYKECILLDEFKSTITTKYKYPLFTIDYDTITIYFNPGTISASYCGILDITIPLDQLKQKLPITEKQEVNTTVEIVAPSKIIDPTHKVVALTFDDGPSKYTNEILKILKENNAYATFFVIGNKVAIYEETMQKMVTYGNEIGNHSYNHKWLTKLTEEDLKEQIHKTQTIIKDITGYTPVLIRPTYGSISEKLRKQLPLDCIMWTVDTSDWKYKNVDRIVKEATQHTKDLDIILMHDTHKRTVEALKIIIPELQKQGFSFVTVSELKEIKKLREHTK